MGAARRDDEDCMSSTARSGNNATLISQQPLTFDDIIGMCINLRNSSRPIFISHAAESYA